MFENVVYSADLDLDGQVTMVKWNEPYQKLASCDSTGIIFVWIKFVHFQVNRAVQMFCVGKFFWKFFVVSLHDYIQPASNKI